MLQGDTLAPYLFVVVLNYALRIDGREEDVGSQVEKRRSKAYWSRGHCGLKFCRRYGPAVQGDLASPRDVFSRVETSGKHEKYATSFISLLLRLNK